MTRRRSPLVGTSGSTFEFITLRDQILGILIPAFLMVLVRALFWMLFGIMALAVGQQAGGLLALSVAVYFYVGVLTGRVRDSKMIPIAMTLSLVLCVIAAFDYWPPLLEWKRIEYQQFYRMSWIFDGEWIPVYWAVVWLRLFAVLFLPLVVWSPFRFSDWALGIEITWPKARETGFTPGNPESIPDVGDRGIQAARHNVPTDGGESVVIIPAPTVQGQ